MEIIQREELLVQLKDMQKLVKQCPKGMYFSVNVEFNGVDTNFMEMSKKFMIAKALRQKQQLKKLAETQSNI